MSQTYHSLLSFWKLNLHVASLLEKQILYVHALSHLQSHCAGWLLCPAWALAGTEVLIELDSPLSLAGNWLLWPGTELLLKHWLKVVESKNWMQILEEKTILSSPSHLLPDCPSLVGWQKENRKCIFVVCDRLQRSKNSIYYISAAILCNGMLLGVWVALMCAPLGQIFPMKIAIKSSLARFKIYFTSK